MAAQPTNAPADVVRDAVELQRAVHRERPRGGHPYVLSRVREQPLGQGHPVGAGRRAEGLERPAQDGFVGVEQHQGRHEAVAPLTGEDVDGREDLGGVLAREALDQELRALEVERLGAFGSAEGTARDRGAQQLEVGLSNRHGHGEPGRRHDAHEQGDRPGRQYPGALEGDERSARDRLGSAGERAVDERLDALAYPHRYGQVDELSGDPVNGKKRRPPSTALSTMTAARVPPATAAAAAPAASSRGVRTTAAVRPRRRTMALPRNSCTISERPLSAR